MPYPKKLLNEGEEVALDLRPHWWYFSKHIVTGIPLFVVLVSAVVGFGAFVLWLVLVVKAFQGVMFQLPVLGALALQQAAKS